MYLLDQVVGGGGGSGSIEASCRWRRPARRRLVPPAASAARPRPLISSLQITSPDVTPLYVEHRLHPLDLAPADGAHLTAPPAPARRPPPSPPRECVAAREPQAPSASRLLRGAAPIADSVRGSGGSARGMSTACTRIERDCAITQVHPGNASALNYPNTPALEERTRRSWGVVPRSAYAVPVLVRPSMSCIPDPILTRPSWRSLPVAVSAHDAAAQDAVLVRPGMRIPGSIVYPQSCILYHV